MYSRVPACQITTFYYVGFAYLMMRRYQDAIRTFSNILLYIQRTKQMFQARVQMYDQVGSYQEICCTKLTRVKSLYVNQELTNPGFCKVYFCTIFQQ